MTGWLCKTKRRAGPGSHHATWGLPMGFEGARTDTHAYEEFTRVRCDQFFTLACFCICLSRAVSWQNEPSVLRKQTLRHINDTQQPVEIHGWFVRIKPFAMQAF